MSLGAPSLWRRMFVRIFQHLSCNDPQINFCPLEFSYRQSKESQNQCFTENTRESHWVTLNCLVYGQVTASRTWNWLEEILCYLVLKAKTKTRWFINKQVPASILRTEATATISMQPLHSLPLNVWLSGKKREKRHKTATTTTGTKIASEPGKPESNQNPCPTSA